MNKSKRIWECIRQQESAFKAADIARCAGCSDRHARRFLRLLSREGLVVQVGREPVPPGRRGKGAELWVCADPGAEIEGAHRDRSQSEATSIRWTSKRRLRVLFSPDDVADAVFMLMEAGVKWADICSRVRLRDDTLRAAMRERGLVGAPAGRLRKLMKETLGEGEQ